MFKTGYSDRRRNQASIGFGRRKLIWLEAVAARRDIPRSALHVAQALATFFNSKTLQAWPSIRTLADICGLCERQVQRLVQALEETGLLSVARRFGRGLRATFEMVEPEPVEIEIEIKQPVKKAPTATPSNFVWISATAPDWAAWARIFRLKRGKSPPIDSRGGWRFPVQFRPT